MNLPHPSESVAESIWVYIESGGMCRYGRLSRRHYEAVLSGNYTARFLVLEDVFWLSDGKPVRASQRSVAPLFEGTFHISTNYIALIAPVDDCTKLFLPFVSDQSVGMSAWEREQQALESKSAAPKKRRRKEEPAGALLP